MGHPSMTPRRKCLPRQALCIVQPGLRTRALLICLWIGMAGTLPEHACAADEGALKAAIVFNLLQFVQWPAEVEAQPGGSVMGLCAERHGSLWQPLQGLQGRALRQWKLDVREVPSSSSDLAQRCQVWVLEPRRAGAAPSGLTARAAIDKPILTIGDSERADEEGVAVGLTQANGRIIFDVDLVVARANKLHVSAKVLRLARGVRE